MAAGISSAAAGARLRGARVRADRELATRAGIEITKATYSRWISMLEEYKGQDGCCLFSCSYCQNGKTQVNTKRDWWFVVVTTPLSNQIITPDYQIIIYKIPTGR